MPLREYLRRGSSSRSTPPSSSTSQVAAPKCPALPNNCRKKAKHLFKGRRLMSALRSHFTKQRTWAGGSKSERKKETTSNGGTLGYHHISYPAVREHLNCAKWRGNMRMGWCAGDLITASTHRSKSSAHSTKQAECKYHTAYSTVTFINLGANTAWIHLYALSKNPIDSPFGFKLSDDLIMVFLTAGYIQWVLSE